MSGEDYKHPLPGLFDDASKRQRTIPLGQPEAPQHAAQAGSYGGTGMKVDGN